ncbi:MAG: lamin tail domain-containing protein [Planctomycetes bacterium]|nr:lamin tail domain-containing protein [Planctomycetota bacterium]
MLLLCLTASAEGPSGDLNGDYRVDLADLTLLGDQWLAGPEAIADLNQDGQVDGFDLVVLADHWGQRDCPIVINELLAHAHAEASDWIELHNLSSAPVPLGGWFLSDNKKDLRRYQIAAGTVIEPYGYLLLYETIHFGNSLDPGLRKAFAFTEHGETAYLSSGDDPVFADVLIEQPFGPSDTGDPFGRHRTSLGTYDFVTMSVPTPGAANRYPRIGPLVIREIMYHPAGNADAEYIELANISDLPVTLFDPEAQEPWQIMSDSGVSVAFPTHPPVTVRTGEIVLLVRDPVALKFYDVPAGVRIFTWGSGKLDNGSGSLQILRPGDVDEWGLRHWIEVERVNYSDGSHGRDFPRGLDPWPVQADGFGFSLTRILPGRYGNDPNNWQATLPTPGTAHP